MKEGTMSQIPECVTKSLDIATYGRPTGQLADVAAAIGYLGLSQDSLVAAFYAKYRGVFDSANVGYDLLDLIEGQRESVLASTKVVRDKYGFAARFIVLTAMLGLAVLIYDVETDRVYDVDFEGGERLLKEGKLEPSWDSFGDFLISYFC
jgi:hypothetical protein